MKAREAKGLSLVADEFPDDLPKIPAGMWRTKSAVNGKPNGGWSEPTCVQEQEIRALMRSGFMPTRCPEDKRRFAKEGGGYVWHAECDYRGEKRNEIMDSKLTGDLKTNYTVERKSKFDKPGPTGKFEETYTLSGEYRGACSK
jgi:hypothetical protein